MSTKHYQTPTSDLSLGILSNSKKIKKSSSPISSKSTPKKYLTMSDSKKSSILSYLESALRNALRNDFSPSEISSMDLLDLITKTHVADYNDLIERVLDHHEISFSNSEKEFQLWRKKIKNWISRPDKDDERRGGVLVPKAISCQFTVIINFILDNMKYRCFETLQSAVLPELEELRKTIGLKTDETMCSNHWWFNFLKKNPEIKAKWDSKPCPAKKGGATPSTGRRSNKKRVFDSIISTPETSNDQEDSVQHQDLFKSSSSGLYEVPEAAVLSPSTEYDSEATPFEEHFNSGFGCEMQENVQVNNNGFDSFMSVPDIQANFQQPTIETMLPSSNFYNHQQQQQQTPTLNLNTTPFRISTINNNNNFDQSIDNYFSFQSNAYDFLNSLGNFEEPSFGNQLSPFIQPPWCDSPNNIDENINDTENQWKIDEDLLW